MLRYRADWQTLLYMLACTALPIWHWQLSAINPALLLASLVMAFAVAAMHHNHSHVPIWKSPVMNLLTDYWFTLLQGHPGYVFSPAHLDNHHRYLNSERDITRTTRFTDKNNLLGFVLHPLQAACALLPLVGGHLKGLWLARRKQFLHVISHYAVLAGCIAIAVALDWRKAILFVVLPQATALFFLLASNYLQHAHTDETSLYNHSRNFTGLLNRLFFNVGYHTAHHHHSDLHWSRLPEAHRRIAGHIHRDLMEKSFMWYCVRTCQNICPEHCATDPAQQSDTPYETRK